MTDAAVVGRILREYRLGPASVRRRYGSVSGAWVGYELDRPDEDAVLVRAYRADVPLAPYLRGCGTASVTEWLLGRAATLDWLASRGHPAPRAIATRSDDLIGVAGPWLTWATSFVAGRALPPGRSELLGAALGRLHALGPAAGVGLASWHPAAAVPAALGRLDEVAPMLPGEWRPLHAQFRSTLLAVRDASGRLPVAVVHGDAWPGNAVLTPSGEDVLIDWENGGLGLPVVDLGYCLLECHLDLGSPRGSPQAWHISPDPGRIGALLDGYARWRRLDGAERSALADGIRFAAAYLGAIHFEQALIGGVAGPAMDARLARLRNRIAVSQAVADLAARHLGTR